jgi:hypothetical protein
MLEHVKLINLDCGDIENELSFREKKVITLMDITLSNKNPDVYFEIGCGVTNFFFKFNNGVVAVEKFFVDRESLFKSLRSFKEAIKNFECDLKTTGFQIEEKREEKEDIQMCSL